MNRSVEPSNTGDVTTAAVDGQALCRLLERVQRGDRLAADHLVREHDSWLRSVVLGTTGRPDLVDDVVQQVWTQAWERLETLQDAGRLRQWLYKIARHAAIDASVAARRRELRTGRLACPAELPGSERRASPVARTVDQEQQEILMQAVQALPAIYREPFVLRHLENWTYAQIAEVLDLPLETVETRLVRARRLLREMLSGKVES